MGKPVVVFVLAGMQLEIKQAEAAATAPDPAVHGSAVEQLQADCRESRARITSLENEAR